MSKGYFLINNNIFSFERNSRIVSNNMPQSGDFFIYSDLVFAQSFLKENKIFPKFSISLEEACKKLPLGNYSVSLKDLTVNIQINTNKFNFSILLLNNVPKKSIFELLKGKIPFQFSQINFYFKQNGSFFIFLSFISYFIGRYYNLFCIIYDLLV